MAIAAGAEDATQAFLMPGGEKPGEAVGMGMDGGKKPKAMLACLESRILGLFDILLTVRPSQVGQRMRMP